MSNAAKEMRREEREARDLRLDKAVGNFMGGTSYTINPLDTLKMITASSIYGEPAYYRDGMSAKKTSGVYKVKPGYVTDCVVPARYEGMATHQVMEQAIDAALAYDFGGTLDWAVELRTNFNMRLNPQVIMVRAAMHPNRSEFTAANPGKFDEINQRVMSRADEPMAQMAYFMFLNKGKKNQMPSVIKRSWANKIGGLGRYAVAKYKNHEIGMINAVRLCHATSPVIDELMTTGTVEVSENNKTWENLRSEGKTWKEIFHTVNMGHMALLRNLRGVFTEVDDINFCREYLDKLKLGVVDGKQFPFRYSAARDAVLNSNCNHKSTILDALEECFDLSLATYPQLKGKTICLSDNSGSAWDTFNSEFGSTTIAEIDNLSSVITAACSEDGYVGEFGDRLIVHPVSKREGLLAQAKKISSDHGRKVGGNTEGGIWEFFHNAIQKKEHWDNIFIYSDQQAGHGGLYGTSDQAAKYSRMGFQCGGSSWCSYINVYKLILEYRKKVNPKVNVFCIQTAGYNNVLIPEMSYRTAIQYGWTGKEAVFAAEYIRQWDEMENRDN